VDGAKELMDPSLIGSQRSVDALRLSVRASNCLKQAGIATVGQLMQCTQLQLLRLPNLGQRTLREIREALAVFQESPEDQHKGKQNSGDPADEIERTADSESRIESAEGESNTPAEPQRRILAFLSGLRIRERSVLIHRVFRSDITLEELGQRFTVTRERIRQIEGTLRKRVRSYLSSADADAINACAQEFRAQIGRALPVDAFEEYCAEWPQLNGASDADRKCLAAFIGWIAGPYMERGGWATTEDYSAREIVEALVNARDDRGWISPIAVRVTLLGAGVRGDFHHTWMVAHRFWPIDGGWLPHASNMLDRAEQLLRYRLEPMSAEAMYPLVESESERSLRNRLSDDERFKRVSRQGHFALREWTQYEEYSGIAAEIAEEIERQGGVADSQNLIDVLSARFGVRPNSVYQYLSAPMFVKARGGRVRMRTDEEAIAVRANPTLCQGLYRVDHQWKLRTEITAETLRGSGRPLQTAVAVLVGCQPGGRRVLRSPASEIVVSWPAGSASGPNLGSLRPDLQSLGGRVGDYLFLTLFDRSIDVSLLKAERAASGPTLERLSLLVGLAGSARSETESWAAIGSAIGIDARGGVPDPEEVYAQLVRRNEVSLARLAREACPHAVENIFERLEGTLGL